MAQVTMLLFYFCSTLSLVNCADPSVSDWSPHDQIVSDILKGYNATSFPPPEQSNKPLEITYNLYVRELLLHVGTSGHTPLLITTLTLREMWKDTRLAFKSNPDNVPYVVIPNQFNIWFPDTFFLNEARSRPILRDGWERLVRVQADGTVLVSQRLSHSFRCPITAYNYPFESANCDMSMGSYAFTTEHLKLKWLPKTPIQIRKNATTSQFDLLDAKASQIDVGSSTGFYSCIKALFILKRNSGSQHIFELFFCPGSFVAISWICFILPAWKRSGLGLLLVLFIVFVLLVSQVYQNFPLARFSLVHTWVSGCGFFLVAEIVCLLILCLIDDLLQSKSSGSIKGGILTHIIPRMGYNSEASQQGSNLLENEYEESAGKGTGNRKLENDVEESRWISVGRIAASAIFAVSFIIFAIAIRASIS